MAREIKTTIDNNTNTLTISVEGKAPITITLSELSKDILEYAALHGLKQKICDAAALGAGYSLTEKYNAMVEVFERLTGDDPSWNKRAEGGGAVTGLLYRALCRLYPQKSPEAIRTYHDKLDKKQQAALRNTPKIALIIEEIKAEAVNTSGVNTDNLLDELEGI